MIRTSQASGKTVVFTAHNPGYALELGCDVATMLDRRINRARRGRRGDCQHLGKNIRRGCLGGQGPDASQWDSRALQLMFGAERIPDSAGIVFGTVFGVTDLGISRGEA